MPSGLIKGFSCRLQLSLELKLFEKFSKAPPGTALVNRP